MTDIDYKKIYSDNPHKARQALFDEYCSYVYAVAYNRLRSVASREDIEECVSDVFSDLYIKLDGDTELLGDLKTYIAMIAKRRAIDRFRAASNKKMLSVSLYEDDISRLRSQFDLEEEIEKSELRHVILDHISALGEPDSIIIFQKFYYERSSNEIAKILQMTPTAVRTRCHRALKRLKKSLKKSGITL